MRKIALIMMCLVLCAASAIVCDAVLAGPLENACEFQEKIVDREEQRSSDIGSGSEGDNITYQDADSSDNADSVDQAGQQQDQ